jgi:hypothetical protein
MGREEGKEDKVGKERETTERKEQVQCSNTSLLQ